MQEYKNIEHVLTEDELQNVAGGTLDDANTWKQNLSEEEQRLRLAYKKGNLIDKADIAKGRALDKEYKRLKRLPEKILSDGASASRVGQLRPKK
jgi:bacteriocin-like protein